MYWFVSERNQGQIVELGQSQIVGAPEGETGPGRGLTRRVDRSDKSWSIEDAKLGTIAKGGPADPIPSVPEAIAIRKAKRT